MRRFMWWICFFLPFIGMHPVGVSGAGRDLAGDDPMVLRQLVKDFFHAVEDKSGELDRRALNKKGRSRPGTTYG